MTDTWPADTLADMACWLLARLEPLRHHPAAAEAHQKITDAVEDARRVVDRPANRTSFHVGPCPEPDCQGQVRAVIPATEDRPAHMTCEACGARWETHQWMRAGVRILRTMGLEESA